MKKNHHFYVLDEEFETIAETGKKLIGSYKWWKAALVGKSHLSGEDINLAKTMFKLGKYFDSCPGTTTE